MTKCSDHHLQFSSPDHKLPITTHDLYFRPFDDCLRYDINGKVTEDTKFSINHPALKIQNSKFIGSPEDKFETMLFLPEGENRKGEGGLRTKGYFKHSYKMVDGKWFITDSDNNPVVPAPDDIQSKIKQYLSSNAQYQSPITELPLITVITVVYNGDKYLEETILSVINQTYPNVEYIIIDGGSTDGTLDIIKKYEHAIDYWVSEPDKGIYDAMNKGIDLSIGKWVYFLGADDFLFNILYRVTVHLDDKKDAIYGDVYMPKRHKLYNGKFTKFKIMFKNICHQAIFYNKNVFKSRKFDEKYKLLADYAFNLSIFNEKSFLYVPVLVAYYNDIDGSSSTGMDIIFQKERTNVIKKYFPFYLSAYFLIRKMIVNLLDYLGLKELTRKWLKGCR